jgi:glyoxylase-like metal-dependent hydrolase (beta-lactamase superfamily II)
MGRLREQALKASIRLALSVGFSILFQSAYVYSQGAANSVPLIEQDDALAISDHVYVILDDNRRFVPNVGIVVGNKATLVIDPGLGLKNGEIVLEEARKLSSNTKFFIASTHVHAEHDLGAGAFPQEATMIRSQDQQRDIEEFDLQHAGRLSKRSKVLANLLENAFTRPADVLCDTKCTIDLGGVNVTLQAVGPAHTFGDTAFFVEEDRVLFSGDVVMRRYPRFASPTSGLEVWLSALTELKHFDFDVLVPSHGPLGGTESIEAYEAYFTHIQSRVGELLAKKVSTDTIVEQITLELLPELSDWKEDGARFIDIAVRKAIDEANLKLTSLSESEAP